MQISGKEKREVLKATIDRIEDEVRDLNKSTIYIEVNGKKVKFETKLTFDQVDKKVIKELCGCNGSYCLFCDILQADASNPIIIRKGFKVTKKMSDIIAKQNELDAQGKLNSNTSSKVRGGATHLSLASDLLDINHILPPLHAKINLLTNVLNLLYLFNARSHFENKWPLCDGPARKRTDFQKKKVDEVEKEFQADAMKKPLNLKLGQHIIGSGGTRYCSQTTLTRFWHFLTTYQSLS